MGSVFSWYNTLFFLIFFIIVLCLAHLHNFVKQMHISQIRSSKQATVNAEFDLVDEITIVHVFGKMKEQIGR